MNSILRFETFTEFCERADEILSCFITYESKIKLSEYQRYIYHSHCFSENTERDILCKNKCWEWLMSYKYESMNKNDLYSVLGLLQKGR